MHVFASTPAEQELEIQLHAWATCFPQHWRALGYWYDSPYDFLFQYGQWYAPRSLPSHIPLGAPLACFGNALATATLKDLIYVEGYAALVIREETLVFHHAWCTNALGQLFEVTWLDPGVAYFGVQFSVGRAEECIYEGDGSVLWDDRRIYDIHIREI
jgi:hypothetical protein